MKHPEKSIHRSRNRAFVEAMRMMNAYMGGKQLPPKKKEVTYHEANVQEAWNTLNVQHNRYI